MKWNDVTADMTEDDLKAFTPEQRAFCERSMEPFEALTPEQQLCVESAGYSPDYRLYVIWILTGTPKEIENAIMGSIVKWIVDNKFTKMVIGVDVTWVSLVEDKAKLN